MGNHGFARRWPKEAAAAAVTEGRERARETELIK